MKSFRILLLAAFVVLCTAQAQADSIPTGDPIIRTGGGGSAGAVMLFADPAAPAGIITPDFTIESPSGSSPATSPCILIQGTLMTSSPECLFENDITRKGAGLAIAQLLFDVGGLTPGTAVGCDFLTGSPFTKCIPGTANASGEAHVAFFDGLIPFHTDFTLDFEGFPANTSFVTTAGIVPEPGTLALFLGGIGALLVRRRLCAR